MKNTIGWMGVFIAGVLCSCQVDRKPQGVLEKEKFAEVLVDLYAGQARLTGISIMPDSAVKLFRPFEEAMLQKNEVTDSIMRITFEYYTEHPTELEAVYDIAIDTLSLREQRAGTIKKIIN